MASKTAIQHFDDAAKSYEELTGGCTRELARYILTLTPDTGTESTILDNASGPAIVTEELLLRTAAPHNTPRAIHVVDASPAMIEAARAKKLGLATTAAAAATTEAAAAADSAIHFAVMPAESLEFSDNTFTHSFTNLGILFFADAVQGAREIFRTLQPGGVAVVTSWADLGYLDIVRKAQAAVRPDATPYALPISESWFLQKHVEDVLREGGFSSIEVHEREVHLGAASLEGVCGLLVRSFGSVCMDWDGGEQEAFKARLVDFARPVAREYRVGGGADGGADGFGIPMMAIVAVARK